MVGVGSLNLPKQIDIGTADTLAGRMLPERRQLVLNKGVLPFSRTGFIMKDRAVLEFQRAQSMLSTF